MHQVFLLLGFAGSNNIKNIQRVILGTTEQFYVN